jgi:hypothetical protein
MKKISLLIYTLPLAASLQAQEPADALRYSWTTQGGTARQQAIGGAMGSLGGDISAVYGNPAGLAFYKTGDFVFGGQYRMNKTKATYMERKEEDSKGKLLWNTTGFVIGGRNDLKKRNGAFSIAINRAADFNSNVIYRGQTTGSSYAMKYLEEIRNNGERDAHTIGVGEGNYRFGAGLALQTGWIDTAAGGSAGNFDFRTNAPFATGLLQQQTLENRGGVTELAFGVAVSYNDKWMLGGSIGVPFLRYTQDAEYVEADATSNANNKFNYASITEKASTTGAGLNLRLGAIYKPQEYWRLGLSFQTPTIYSLTNKYTSTVTTDTENFLGVQTSSSDDADFLDSYGEYSYKYMMTTPYKATGSISYVLREIEDVRKQKGFLTADVEYVNYKAASFMQDDGEGISDPSDKEYLKSLNKTIDKIYKGAFNFRAGGELKFTTIMVRLGAAYYGNPYKNINGEKGSRLNLSGGLGYRDQGFFIDLTYVHSMQKDVHFPYRLENTALYKGANLKSNLGNALLTVGFKF